MTVQISFSNPSCRYASDMCSCINSVLKNHPLGADILTSEVLKNLEIAVELKAEAETNIDCKQYPTVRLVIDPANYERRGHFEKKLLKRHLYHEFTHLIDRLNTTFELGLEKVPEANVSKMWNVYIDGRLWRRGIKIKSREEYHRFLFGRRLDKGLDCSKAINLCETVWNTDSLTYQDIISLTKAIIGSL